MKPCQICGDIFRRPEKLAQHMKEFHMEENSGLSGYVVVCDQDENPAGARHLIASYLGARHVFDISNDISDIVNTMMRVAEPVIFTRLPFGKLLDSIPSERIVGFSKILPIAERLHKMTVDRVNSQSSAEMPAGPFWIVWSPQGQRPPRYRHDTEESAITEAARLAGERIGAQFFVLEAKSRAFNPGLTITHLAPTDDNEVPF